VVVEEEVQVLLPLVVKVVEQVDHILVVEMDSILLDEKVWQILVVAVEVAQVLAQLWVVLVVLVLF
jgi:hypothetical protein